MKQGSKAIITECISCRSRYRASDEFIGKKMRCRKCGNTFVVNPVQGEKQYPLICRLALKYKLISEKPLEDALSDYGLQKQTGMNSTVEEFLVAKKLIPRQKMDILIKNRKNLEIRQRDQQYGAIAVKSGLVTPQQVKEALAIQTRQFQENKMAALIGDILVESGVLTQQQNEMILAGQRKLKKAGLSPPNSVPPAGSRDTNKTMKAAEGAEPGDQKASEEIVDTIQAAKLPSGKIELTVSENGVTAYIRNTMSPSDVMTVEEIKDFLAGKQIRYGIVDDSLIDGFLKSQIFRKKRFKIASGIAPKFGRDAVIKYYFEKDHLKSGAITSEGIIDFKDRGTIPHVEKGTLIAEKIPVEEAVPGIDVYGNPITVPEVRDVKILLGSGTKLSGSGLKVYAKIDGQPYVTLGGKISVLSQLTINGNVGYETGHVEFDGNIEVKGIVQNGFRVKGANLSAMAITGAEIDVTGDVTVAGGITDSAIHAQGNVKATYINKAKISTYGSIVVRKQIIDSNIENSGTCIVEKGAIVSSTITSRKGIKAADVGTDVSNPCNLRAGADDHFAREVEGIKKGIARRRKRCKELEAALQQLQEEDQQIQKEITVLAHVQDRAMLEQKSLKEELSRLNDQKVACDPLSRMQNEFKELEIKARNAEKELDQSFQKQELLLDKIQATRNEINGLKEQLEELNIEKKAIIEWSRKEKPIPVVEASGAIQGGTIISGIHATTILKDTVRHASIRETRISDPDSSVEWEMRIHS